MQLISNAEQAMKNIRWFSKHAQSFQDLMSYHRAWYALKTEDGNWLLGPSKVIGYEEPDQYLAAKYRAERHGRVQDDGDVLDGRITESVLRSWAEPVEKGHPEYEKLHAELNALCARYGKRPNHLSRISIIRAKQGSARPRFSDDLVRLLAAVYRELTPAQQLAFKSELA